MSDLENDTTTDSVVIDPKESPFKWFLEHPDKYLFALCAVPLLGSLIIYITGLDVMWGILVYLVPNVILGILDEKALKSQDRVTPTNWLVLIIPVYICQRLKLNGQKKNVFYIWVASFIFSAIVDSAGIDAVIEAEACELVTQIIHEQYYNTSTDCIGVKLGDEIGNNFYKATAVLTNGNTVDITIDLRKDDEIYVRMVD